MYANYLKRKKQVIYAGDGYLISSVILVAKDYKRNRCLLMISEESGNMFIIIENYVFETDLWVNNGFTSRLLR